VDSDEVAALVRAEIREKGSGSNAHGLDLRMCIVTPRKIRCRNTFPDPDHPKPPILELWLVLEEVPGSAQGYVIVFDESEREFGLAYPGDRDPAFLGWYGDFWTTLHAM
jgi:hypothetical protein